MDIEEVQKNRQKIIKKAVEMGKFNIFVYADYFEVKTVVIQNDLKEIFQNKSLSDLDLYSGSITRQELMQQREKIIEKKEKQGISEEDILVSLGMWHTPIIVKTPTSLLAEMMGDILIKSTEKALVEAVKNYRENPNQDTETKMLAEGEKLIPHLSECLEELQLGRSVLECKKMYNLTDYHYSYLRRLSSAMSLNNTPDYAFLNNNKISEPITAMINEGVPIYKISKITGITNANLVKIKEDGELKKSTRDYSKCKLAIEERRKKVWQLYNLYGSTHGLTQLEIGKILNVDRATINTDLRAYKKEHPDEIDKTQLYRSRHAGEAKYLQRMEKVQLISRAFELVQETYPEATNWTICKKISEMLDITKYPIAPQTVNYMLIDMAKIMPINIKHLTPKAKAEMSHNSKVGYAHKGQFGKGATAILLGEKEYTSSSERERARQQILTKQKRTMALIRNSAGIREEWERLNGNMLPILDNLPQNELNMER